MFPFVDTGLLKAESTIKKQAEVKSWLVAHGWSAHVNQFHSQAVHDLETLFFTLGR